MKQSIDTILEQMREELEEIAYTEDFRVTFQRLCEIYGVDAEVFILPDLSWGIRVTEQPSEGIFAPLPHRGEKSVAGSE